ncbi:hypothetical protein V6B16_11475 [Salinimicrobium catena]|uniref:hypothetical protein n=1 Tax=Salinimicrobium catena TaxID=390640 RepID=UPI002FE43B39
MKNQKEILTDEVAIPELRNFINPHLVGEQLEEAEVKENYPAVLRALKEGKLILSESKPKLVLTEPVKNDAGEEVLTEVEFRTRIRPNELANLSKGLNLNKDSFQYALRCTAFIIDQPSGYLNKLGKFDYTVIQQLSAVFM